MSEELKPGDRVVMTEHALRQGLDGPHGRFRGVVTHVSPRRGTVYVKRDGLRGSVAYSPKMWKKESR
jgi:hypothetical protein